MGKSAAGWWTVSLGLACVWAGCSVTPSSDAGVPSIDGRSVERDAALPQAVDADWGASNCTPGGGECAAGEICAAYRASDGSRAGYRCSAASDHPRAEGEACAWDMPLPSSPHYVTSGCGDTLLCSDGRCREVCSAACDWDCAAGVCRVACAHVGDSCGAGLRCAVVGDGVTHCGASGGVPLGGACTASRDCVGGAGCLRDVCVRQCELPSCWPTCEPGACDDGSICSVFEAPSEIGVGFCGPLELSTCALGSDDGCADGERCAWAITPAGVGAAVCTSERGALALGDTCTNDQTVTIAGRELHHSACGAGLGCSARGETAGECVVPCELGCDEGSRCPARGAACVPYTACVDGRCPEGEHCEGLLDVPGPQRWGCLPFAREGEPCSDDPEQWCEPGLECRGTCVRATAAGPHLGPEAAASA